MTATPLEIYEELRFLLELLSGMAIFLLPFVHPGPHAVKRALLGIPVLFVLLLIRFPILANGTDIPLQIRVFEVGLLYPLTTLGCMLLARACFPITVSDALFFTSAGYAVQHLVYISVHEVLIRDVWTALPQNLPLYVLVSIVGCLIFYVPAYSLFATKLRQCNGRMQADTRGTVFSNLLFLVVLIAASMYGQDMYEYAGEWHLRGAALGTMASFLILAVLYQTLSAVHAEKERTITEQMLRDAERHYNYSRELIEYVNRAVHDLKHTARALEQAPAEQRKQFAEETLAVVNEYQQMVYSENEVLNTILSEKALMCRSKEISFSVSMGQADLSFFSAADLYVLLGNAIDNAVESAEKIEDPEKRAISITIQSKAGAVVIQTNNYFTGTLKMEDGLPRTTRSHPLGHGYGLKNIRGIAEKYGGTLSVTAHEGVFILIVLLPAVS